MDGHALDLNDDAFDVAVSMNGVSLFPDMARGLAELVRVTRPGGRVVIVAFGPIRTVEFIVFVTSALRAAVPGVTRAEVTHILDGMLRERSAGAPGAVLRAELDIGIGTV